MVDIYQQTLSLLEAVDKVIYDWFKFLSTFIGLVAASNFCTHFSQFFNKFLFYLVDITYKIIFAFMWQFIRKPVTLTVTCTRIGYISIAFIGKYTNLTINFDGRIEDICCRLQNKAGLTMHQLGKIHFRAISLQGT